LVEAGSSKHKGMTMKEALELLGGLENFKINDGFLLQLTNYEKKLFGKNSLAIFDKNQRAAKIRNPLSNLQTVKKKK